MLITKDLAAINASRHRAFAPVSEYKANGQTIACEEIAKSMLGLEAGGTEPLPVAYFTVACQPHDIFPKIP